MPSISPGLRPASVMAFLTASTPIARVVRPELRVYAVSPTPTIQYLSRRFAIRFFLSARHADHPYGRFNPCLSPSGGTPAPTSATIIGAIRPKSNTFAGGTIADG